MTIFLVLLLALVNIAPPPSKAKQAVQLDFREFFAPAATELKPSEKLRSLQGKRVRITGFAAQMEARPEGYFYLCAQLVYCDESGGGIGELPIDAVRVLLPIGKRQLPPIPTAPIIITGRLELGGQSAAEQDSWAIRIRAEEILSAPRTLGKIRSPFNPKR